MRLLMGLSFWLINGLVWSCSSPKEELTVYFTGDLLLDRGVREQIEKKGPDFLFQQVSPLFTVADFTVANLECPVTERVAPLNKKYIFRANPVWLKAIRTAGITHLDLANNHTNDQGRAGMRDTWKNIRTHGLQAIGYGENQEQACKPVILEKGSISVAIFTSVLVPLENWPYLPDSAGICQATAGELASRISDYKRKFPENKVAVVLHWGVEFQESPTVTQRQQARTLLAAGADAVIGHHPHVIQKAEYFQGKPVFYSLGNFVFDQKQPLARRGLLVKLTFTPEKMDVKEIPITIERCAPEPEE